MEFSDSDKNEDKDIKQNSAQNKNNQEGEKQKLKL